ncbi:alpha/beta hydrolase family protein [Roseofilum capinflatum]|uniref:Alpha/beta hydrolase n=1 Tax=Roseofilum capinflatum BLCC-M114 TaxID=3022440 RepID=A0ABT7B9Y9_9CYAN|nr:alpha/beta hydrolase [Roseofilum capinflatum]MDJ1175981.1 alpha/beta hydrolase [Roseofilum capinflatum BLCC-M114]
MTTQNIPEDKLKTIKFLAEFAVRPMFRTPVHKKPDEYGITDYEDIYFPSDDGVPLEGWLIRAKDSDKLIIANHPMPMSRSGFTGHWGQPWSDVDDLEVDFVKAYAHLVNAGYNVLAYDLRNHGNSGTANGGICGIGRYEWRDCVGVKKYVDSHPELQNMTIGLLSRCTGGNAQYEAIHRFPELFKNVKCMMSPLTVSMTALMTAFATLQGVGEYMDVIDFEQVKLGGFKNSEMTPHLFAPSVKMPVFISQVLDDMWTDNPKDGQTTFDLLASEEKEIFWIEGTKRRFDGYNYFSNNPEKMIAWFDKYMN